MAASNIKAVFSCEPEKVWDIVTSLTNYAWRSDISKIEVQESGKEFSYSDGQTTIDFTEDVTVKKFFMKPFVKSYLKKQQMSYLSDLKKKAGM